MRLASSQFPTLLVDFGARLGLAAALLATVLQSGADADEGWVEAANSRARLNWCGGDQPAASDPNAHELAFLELQIAPGWKTYWRTPGESGVSPGFEWGGTKNLSKATVFYPAPHRLSDQGGEAIGYKEPVVFPIRIQRKDAKAGIALKLELSYGVCMNICVPVEVTVTSGCFGSGIPQAAAQAVDRVPRSADQRRSSDPRLGAITGSVAADPARLSIDVDFGPGATDTDLFIEAPDGLFVPLPAPSKPDAKGKATFVVDLSKTLDPKDLLGKPLRLTMVSSKGASEAVWQAK